MSMNYKIDKKTYLRSRTTEAQLGLAIEFACEIELEFEIHFELGLAFDPEFESSSS